MNDKFPSRVSSGAFARRVIPANSNSLEEIFDIPSIQGVPWDRQTHIDC
jgi:hypothetical protein